MEIKSNWYRGKATNPDKELIRIFEGWTYGEPLSGEEEIFLVEDFEDYSDGDVTDLYATNWNKVIPETVNKFSGETDQYDNEIFGGDILKISPYVDDDYIVAVEEKQGSFIINTPYTSNYDQTVLAWYISDFGKHTIEVIGNRIDNPELLDRLHKEE